ncbi:MAG TPA: aminotransferase class IV [Gemmatimonadaceae bacterium]|jgi:D-alanine transaminase|nr:aminotransferase class IV [Gemmatimonadaceae bacterium]
MLVHLNGRYIDAGEAKISALDRGFIFGDGVYEVWRVVRGQLFEAERHQGRLERGLRELGIARPADGSLERLTAIGQRLLKENDLEDGDATLYVEITRGTAPRMHQFPPVETVPTLLVMASAFAPSDTRFTGTRIITQPDVRWLRCDLKTVQLLPNVMARQAATEQGASEAIFVRDGLITEGTHTTVFAAIDGMLRTHPANHLVLPGVTRDVVIELATDVGVKVRQDAIAVDELSRATELFLTGTTTDVTPVISVDGRPIGNGSPGPIARALLDRLLERMGIRTPALASSRG